jgi:CHAT domain-containing protein
LPEPARTAARTCKAEAKRWLRTLTKDDVIGAIEKRGAVRPLTISGESAVAQPPPQPLPSGQRPFEHPYFWAGFILIVDPNEYRPSVDQ